mgnify:CR=1 FL=1
MLSRNYKILFSLRLLKSILTSFVDVFLVLYFINVSNNNILPLGIYKLVAMVTVYLVVFLLRNYCKSKNRVWLMRIGIILYFIYFLAIILLKENVVDYIYLKYSTNERKCLLNIKRKATIFYIVAINFIPFSTRL